MMETTNRAFALLQDVNDPLAAFRERFVIDDPELIYLDGNSLGRLPQATRALLRDVAERQWGGRLIRSWNEGWFDLANRIGGKIARLIGAQPHEVMVTDSTSVNLFKLATAVLHATDTARRTRIVTDSLNFPSDVYILDGVARAGKRPLRVEVIDPAGGDPGAALAAALDEEVALLSLSHTTFKSGYTYNMAALTAAAHAFDIPVLWDLSHSAGALPVALNACSVDLAVGCTYKYLNGGPGAPAFLYVAERWQEKLRSPIAGWFGQQDLFTFDLTYRPAAGIQRFAAGTPGILALAAVEPGVDLLLEAGMEALRAKSLVQTDYLIALWEAWLAPLGFTLNSPRDPARRGSHISLGHPQALAIDLALINSLNVLPDFRAPDNIRLGVAPIYTRFVDVYEGMARIRRAVEEGVYRQYMDYSDGVVT